MKILVVQIGRYGDMILTTPLFKALKQHYTDCELHVLASTLNHDILDGQSLVDKIYVYRKNFVRALRLITSLRAEKYDLLIDPKDHYSRASSFIAQVVNADFSVGHNPVGREIYSHTLPEVHENDAHDPPLHCTERNCNVLRILGIDTLGCHPVLGISELAMLNVLNIVPTVTKADLTILLNISAGQPHREWQTEKWISLCNKLQRKHRRLVLLSAPRDHLVAKEIEDSVAHKLISFKSHSIKEAVALVSRVDILISPDSAPVHIASVFNVPCVALFNSVPWNLNKFRPLSTMNAVVQPHKKDGEIFDISFTQVLDATEHLISTLHLKGGV